MSTLKTNISARRFALLNQRKEQLFHINDLAVLWGISNLNTLRILLKRYTDAGIFYRVYRGFYSTVPLSALDPILLGAKAIHGPCYLSTESVLFEAGYLAQVPQSITFVGEKNHHFSIGSNHYKCRQLSPQYLYNGAGVEEKNGFLAAGPERALCDLLYFNPKAHLDKETSWSTVKVLQKKLGYTLTPERYDRSKSK